MSIYQGESTKDGRTWYFMTYKKDFNNVNKKYKSKKYKTKSEAAEAERLFLLKRDNPLRKPFTLVADDYFENLLAIRKESTVYTYKNDYKCHIQPFFEKMNIDSIDIQIIRNWAETCDKKSISLNYKNKLYGILKNIFDFAIKNYGLSTNPVAIYGRFQAKNEVVIKDEEKLKYISYESFNKLLTVIDDIMWKTFFILLYYSGMRKGEIQALQICDIDFFNDEIIVNKTLSTKTDSDYKITNTKNKCNRRVKMSQVLRNQLKEYIDYLKKSYSDFNKNWFLFGCVRFLPQTTIYRYKEEYFKLANVDEITIHEFRHSHVSLLINEYIKKCRELNIKIDTYKFFVMVGNRLGHTVEVMQKTYLHLFPTVQDEVVDLLDNL